MSIKEELARVEDLYETAINNCEYKKALDLIKIIAQLQLMERPYFPVENTGTWITYNSNQLKMK